MPHPRLFQAALYSSHTFVHRLLALLKVNTSHPSKSAGDRAIICSRRSWLLRIHRRVRFAGMLDKPYSPSVQLSFMSFPWKFWNYCLVLGYAIGLSYMLYRRTQMNAREDEERSVDLNPTSPMVQSDKNLQRDILPAEGPTDLREPEFDPWVTLTDGDSYRSRSSGYLSKTPPTWAYAI